MKFIDLTGKTFGLWKVIDRSKENFHKPRWNCICTCGNTAIVRGSDLSMGKSTSCGCNRIIKITKHNMSHSETYATWISMIQRCTNPNATAYSEYGGRGITVCKSWLNSFESFLLDMGERPKNKTLDRKDTNKGYSKLNCKWSTRKQQANNRRNCKYLTYKGKTKTIAEWARYLGVVEISLRSRIRSGWTTKRAIETPY
jgi:hypothetical protein